jgi:hypothetical protein
LGLVAIGLTLLEEYKISAFEAQREDIYPETIPA